MTQMKPPPEDSGRSRIKDQAMRQANLLIPVNLISDQTLRSSNQRPSSRTTASSQVLNALILRSPPSPRRVMSQ